MAFVTYEEIESLIDHAEHKQNSMECFFKCPASEKIVRSMASIEQTIANRLGEDAKDSLWRAALRFVERIIRQWTGIYISLTATPTGGKPSLASESAKQDAIVLAFEHVAVYPGQDPRIGFFHNLDGRWVLYTG